MQSGESETLDTIARDFTEHLNQAADPEAYCLDIWHRYVASHSPEVPVVALRDFFDFYKNTHDARLDQLGLFSRTTPLHHIAEKNYDIYLAVRLSQTPNIEIDIKEKKQASSVTTPLHIAAKHGNYHVFELLKNAGADLNLLDDNGNTCLHLAAGCGNSDIVASLLQSEQFTEQSRLNNLGSSALHKAIMGGHKECVELLLPKLSEVRDNQGNTLLHTVVYANRFELVRNHNGLSAQLNATNRHGDTPLDCAINSLRVNLVNDLIVLGLNSNELKSAATKGLYAAARQYFIVNRDERCGVIYKTILKTAQTVSGDFSVLRDKLFAFAQDESSDRYEDFVALSNLVNSAPVVAQQR